MEKKSIFNMMSEQQFNNMAEKYGWNTVLATSEIDSQTVHFWHLQLQFLSERKFRRTFFYCILNSPLYKPNEFSKKINKLLFKYKPWTEEEFACLCTHFALQLSGLEN
jgi:hypothetical protein